MVGFAVVGVGGFAKVWFTAFSALEASGTAKVVAVTEHAPARHRETLAALAAKGCRVYDTYDDLLAGERKTNPVIGLPVGIHYHATMAIEAMEAGYNVLVEKPLAATVQDVARLREVERRTGRWCAVGYQFLNSPTIQWLQSRAASGDLGELVEAKTLIAWPRSTAYYGRNGWSGKLTLGPEYVLDGPAANATAHYITNMLYLAGCHRCGRAEITRVRAELYRAKPIPSYDTDCIRIQLNTGARLLHYASHAVSKSIEPIMDLRYQRAQVHWEATTDTARIDYADGRSEEFANPRLLQIHQDKLAESARLQLGQQTAPKSGIPEAYPHVLATNLAFESSGGVLQIPSRFIADTVDAEGARLTYVPTLLDDMTEAYASGALLSETGIPWAQPTTPVSADGYISFPVRSELKAFIASHSE